MSNPLRFRQVGQLTGEELERAQAYLARLPNRSGRVGPSTPACPHPSEAHVTEPARGREQEVVWCPWCSGDIEEAAGTLVRWFAQEVDTEPDPAVIAQAEALRAQGWAVSPPAVGKARRRATAWDAAAALGVPRKFVAQLLRWLQRAGSVVADGTAEAAWAPTGERMEVAAWRAK